MTPPVWLGLTTLGIVHTAISLVAVGGGAAALLRHGEITLRSGSGKLYVATTVLTCLTGFPIFQHGGFGPPHMLGILTLLVLALAALAGHTGLFGRAGRYIETIAYSASFLFHWIPAITETTTRIPLQVPLLPNSYAPELKVVFALLFVLFLIGVTLQLRRLRARPRTT